MIRRQDPQMLLLGEGLDAIVQHTRQPHSNWLAALLFSAGADDSSLPVQPTAERRMQRYLTASTLYPATRDFPASSPGRLMSKATELRSEAFRRKVRELLAAEYSIAQIAKATGTTFAHAKQIVGQERASGAK